MVQHQGLQRLLLLTFAATKVALSKSPNLEKQNSDDPASDEAFLFCIGYTGEESLAEPK